MVGRRAGQLAPADRDRGGPRRGSVPDAPGSAADTAALMQIARVYQGRPTKKTLVLASIDGSQLGQAGATPPDRGAAASRISWTPWWSSRTWAPSGRRAAPCRRGRTTPRRAGIALQRTVAESIRLELGAAGGGSGTFGQLARLSFPIGIGAQGVLLDSGYDAVRISGSGELPPGGSGPPEAIDADRLGGLGRATLQDAHGPRPAARARSTGRRAICRR